MLHSKKPRISLGPLSGQFLFSVIMADKAMVNVLFAPEYDHQIWQLKRQDVQLNFNEQQTIPLY